MLVLKISLFDVFKNREFELSILIVILISVLALFLFGVGVYLVLQKRSIEEQPSSTIKNSGEFSIIRSSPSDALRSIKPTSDDIHQTLMSSPFNYSDEQAQSEAAKWEESLLASIATVEEGDRLGYSTYCFDLTDKALSICNFLHKDSYITREMIHNHPELLPPFYIGCTAKLISREAWNNQDKSGWMPILPVNGAYQVPDWRQVET